MITIVSTDPQEGATGVFIDKIISVVFSKDIATSYVTSEYIKLYKVTQVDNQTPQYLQIASSLTLVDDNTVRITPGIPLPIDSDYQLLIRGDQNLGDAVPDGIRAVDNDILEGNSILSFTTGAQSSPAPESTVPQYDVGTDDPITGSETDDNLHVLETDPIEDLDVNVATLEELSFIFDKLINVTNVAALRLSSRSLDPSVMPKIDLAVDVLNVSGDTLRSTFTGYIFPSGTNIATVRPAGYGGIEHLLPYNHEYEVKLDKRYISDAELQSSLAQDYTLQFTSTLKPLYAYPYDIRENGLGYIPDSLLDYAIYKRIHANSKYIAKYLGIDYYDPDLVISVENMAKMRQYVICKSTFDLLNSPVLDAGGNRSKSLGDLSITYHGSDKDNVTGLEQLKDELKACYQGTLSANKVKTGVKSYGDRLYPGRETRKL